MTIFIAIMTFSNNQTAGSAFLFGLQLSIYRNIIKNDFFEYFLLNTGIKYNILKAMEQYYLNSDNYSYGDFWINSPKKEKLLCSSERSNNLVRCVFLLKDIYVIK